MKAFSKLALVLPALMLASPAIAADLTAAADLGPVKSPNPTLNWTAGLEVSPEFYAVSKGSNKAGDYADTAIKASLGYLFYDNWTLNTSLQATLKNNSTEQYYGEAGVAYKFKFGDFSLSPQAALGVTWDATGLGDDGTSTAAYYALYLAGDLKLNKQWTWNIFNARWRDAFDYQWQTPKVSTGLTYAFSDAAKLNLNAGYSWKNTGDGYYGDKINLTAAVKYSF
ncbi:hypothetical protein SAMN02745157_4592 [Kaistia soli DSM 19436]|uniref:Uncharacterized protein n=1 Tax=Kaistia soli DSM 19436 TaxID=1122133 RepID=A0A1M5LGI7_9HYPH|nr:hypothetical protein [Kaistia soli]SHG64242.1 hypothetical protein SAMN02745157_4592 [Kaistia soli DSM 19436]